MTLGERTGKAPASVARELKRYLLILVGGVVVLHAIAIGVYYGFHIRDQPNKTQQLFVAVWVAATLILVTTLMKRFRQARRRRR